MSETISRDISDRYARDLRAGGRSGAQSEGADFFNYGYWEPGVRTPREASERLVERLLDWIPERRGKILDVACGAGGTTRVLLRHYAPTDVTAIDVSPEPLKAAAYAAPGCTFLHVDAARMTAFPDASFGAVLCVEAAFHFDTREAYLREALRVLEPGGRLVQSDILFDPSAAALVDRMVHVPGANLVADPDEYRRLLEGVGFDEVVVRDATRECWDGFRAHLARRRRLPKPERPKLADHLRSRLYAFLYARIIRHYVLVSARKPA